MGRARGLNGPQGGAWGHRERGGMRSVQKYIITIIIIIIIVTIILIIIIIAIIIIITIVIIIITIIIGARGGSGKVQGHQCCSSALV